MDIVTTVSFVLLALSQLVLGVAFGWWLCDRRPRQTSPEGEEHNQLVARLSELAQVVTDDVDDHSCRMDQIASELKGLNPRSGRLSDQVLKVVEKIAGANASLQKKLATTREQMREQAEKLDQHITEARIDVLTELANRRAFNDELARRYAELQRTGNPFSLLLIDVDHFKRINDTYGHEGGDRVLKAIGRALRTTVREMDLVARYGGEEFAILLPMTDLKAARRAAERAREAVEKMRLDADLSDARVTVSAGFSQARGEDGARTLFVRADMALYQAKGDGRNCTRAHEDLQENEPTPAAPARALSQPEIVPEAAIEAAQADTVTGLPSRLQLVEELKASVTQARALREDLSLMLIAVDRFSIVTDQHEQLLVDRILLNVAATLSAHARDRDTVLRYGWEDFAVLMPGTDLAAASQMDARFRAALKQALGGNDPTVACPTFSIGITELCDGDDAVAFASRAEAALEKARSSGGNRSCLDTPEPQLAATH
jgi:diguanylate cyclase